MVTTRMVKRLGMGGGVGSLTRVGVRSYQGRVSPIDDVRYYDQAWLRKATDIVEGRRGNVNQSRKRPAATGLFFDFGQIMPIGHSEALPIASVMLLAALQLLLHKAEFLNIDPWLYRKGVE